MNTRKLDAVVVGHICLDLSPGFGTIAGDSLADVLRPGGLLRTEGIRISPGGVVGNTGPALHRLGLRVGMIGRCGDDPLGQILLERLEELAPGAEARLQLVEGEDTSYTIVIAPPGIDRMFLHCPGANDTFRAVDADLDVISRATLCHFGYPPLMRRMYADGGREAAAILTDAQDAGVVTSVDTSLPDPESEAGRADWPVILAAMLPHVDIFLPSLDELMFMLRRERFEELADRGRSMADLVEAEDLRGLAGRCLEMGAGAVVIKCAHLGAYVRTGAPGANFRAATEQPGEWEERELFQPARKVERVVSATGAGDTAVAGFLAAWLRGEPPWRCARFLVAAGAQSLAGIDAISALKSWYETSEEVASGFETREVPPHLRDLAE